MNKDVERGNTWQTQHAKAHFSEVIKMAVSSGDQFITHRGEEIAVVISKSRYENFLTPDVALVDFFYSAPYPDIELDIKRSPDKAREHDL
jgi:antitoxin Phd